MYWSGKKKTCALTPRSAKSLFVTTRKRDRVFLVMVEAQKKADLHRLAQALGTTHLGFGAPGAAGGAGWDRNPEP